MDHEMIANAFFWDSYIAPSTHPDAKISDIFFAIFGHLPFWLKALLISRNKIAALFGLEAPTISEIINSEVKASYTTGDKIGPWPIFTLTDRELVAGRDNKHLDFRLSILRTTDHGGCDVVVSTVCNTHNTFGKIYLFFIVPFHKWGVQRLIIGAIRAGRL